jgi:ribonuclease BN (tRNA processing enzyme)
VENINFIKFLGTSGGRIVMARQLRSSAGVYISFKNKKILLDPGPGTLVRMAASKPRIEVEDLDAIILTHSHIDHSNDVNVLIDSMTGGGWRKRGVLFAPAECISGEMTILLNYLRDFMEDIVVLEAEREYRLGDLVFSTSARHQHPAETYGIKFNIDSRIVSFVVDTKFFPDLMECYKGSDVMIFNVVRNLPHVSAEVMHLNIDDVKNIISTIKPGKAILTHFGRTMLKAKPWELAGRLTNELGVKVIAASDGMTVFIDQAEDS